MIEYTFNGKEAINAVSELYLHKDQQKIEEAISESGKKVNVIFDNCTVENFKKAFAWNPKILHIGGHGVYDFQPRFHSD